MKKEKKRILLVEDASLFREVIKGYLQSEGYDVMTAVNGAEALETASRAGHLDLVISDLDMPVMDGWTFAGKLREKEQYRSLPIIALTALDPEEAEQLTLDKGFVGFEPKLNRERLLGKVAGLLGTESHKEQE